MNKMTPEERRKYNRAEFKRKFGEWWIVYVALFFTAALSFTSGILLPFQPDDKGLITFTVGMGFAAVYYAIGFLVTGEGAFYFWFDKLTDHDPDNTVQVVIAWVMMVISVVTSLTTALAAAGFIAYWLDVFSAFYIMPIWAQKWVVWAIPCFVVLHLVTGTIFRTVSDEATYERDARATIRKAKNDIVQNKETAKADFWRNNASDLAKELGELEAREEIANYKRKIDNLRDKHPQNSQQMRPAYTETIEHPEPLRKVWRLDELLDVIGFDKSDARAAIKKVNNPDEWYNTLKGYGIENVDISKKNFAKLFYELKQVNPQNGGRKQ